jgi:Flp pilus assembly protein TadG
MCFDRLSRPRALVRRFVRDGRGAAAIEFALVVPLLLTLYLVTLEAAQGIETNKKVGRVASMVADLVTQQPEISRAEIEAILKIGETIIQPYHRSVPKIIVTAIDVKDAATAEVVWSRKLENGSYSRGPTPGSRVTVPAKLMTPGTFLVRVEAALHYETMITWAAGTQKKAGLLANFGDIDMSESYFLRPRMSNSIPCDGC